MPIEYPAPRVSVSGPAPDFTTGAVTNGEITEFKLSDLAGKSEVEQPGVADRKFLEIDVDNFDDRMKGIAPRAAFTVPNTLTGEGNMAVDITFESMDDFSPAAIASKVEPLRELLDARTQLSNLMTYMDGKTGAEELIAKVLSDPTLLQALQNPIEYYFSRDNLASDPYLVSQMNAQLYVPIATILSFSKIRALTTDPGLVVEAVQELIWWVAIGG